MNVLGSLIGRLLTRNHFTRVWLLLLAVAPFSARDYSIAELLSAELLFATLFAAAVVLVAITLVALAAVGHALDWSIAAARSFARDARSSISDWDFSVHGRDPIFSLRTACKVRNRTRNFEFGW